LLPASNCAERAPLKTAVVDWSLRRCPKPEAADLGAALSSGELSVNCTIFFRIISVFCRIKFFKCKRLDIFECWVGKITAPALTLPKFDLFVPLLCHSRYVNCSNTGFSGLNIAIGCVLNQEHERNASEHSVVF
jgi:hypothetical protein